ncbi:hypothetical protein [Nonlabens ulvanivorans]|uniref:Uncharacterized protein n=1 Tax=Nonlabens ulvanivorans TaxID=906888 RepID=A0A084JUG5_NONUL|nr:hypothetical protein [Nonlabens ulvanivorans]KEZ92599.1 hypothetical protein IL45_10655 [Nonlabens ulvanivorans]PRX15439.1 hypothetical protein LY02_00656 [Nonlabens ulvanivorans]
MKNLSIYLSILLIPIVITSCSTDFPRQEIVTANLSGFIEGGNAGGIYGDAGLKITKDSIQMTDWPVSRLTTSLNALLDTTLIDKTSLTDFYTIQIENKGLLKQREFIDSLVVVLNKQDLIK